MSRKTKIVLMVLAAAVTIYGLVTGKFLFLLFVFPLGFSFFRKNKKE
ncbi:hypothetical protein [Bizionia argentinensis]|nr:hypothetical protein [Bizionia argentinensis]